MLTEFSSSTPILVKVSYLLIVLQYSVLRKVESNILVKSLQTENYYQPLTLPILTILTRICFNFYGRSSQ